MNYRSFDVREYEFNNIEVYMRVLKLFDKSFQYYENFSIRLEYERIATTMKNYKIIRP